MIKPSTTQSSVAIKITFSLVELLEARLWNTLPSSVNSFDELAVFKVSLRKWLERFPDDRSVTGIGIHSTER